MYTPVYVFAYLIILILYNLELFDFLALNTNSWVHDYTRLFTNTLLTNALNKYHPLIFYVGTLIVYSTTLLLVLRSFVQPTRYDVTNTVSYLSYFTYHLLLTFIITIFMGG